MIRSEPPKFNQEVNLNTVLNTAELFFQALINKYLRLGPSIRKLSHNDPALFAFEMVGKPKGYLLEVLPSFLESPGW